MPSVLRRSAGTLSRHGAVPPADEQRGDRADIGRKAGDDAPLQSLQVGVGRGPVLLGGEQQGDVDRDAGEDRFLDRRQAFRGAGDLDEQVGPVRLGVQSLGLFDRRLRVVGEQRRHLQRHEPVHRAGPRMDRQRTDQPPG